jgi:N-terminal region of Chorein or VPS13
MAKRLLLNVLLQVLGDFIDGLTEDNLKLAVWSGRVVLDKKLLSKYNAPFSLRYGVIKRLELVVPWGSLESNPVKICIDGVYIQLEPLDLSSLDTDQIRANMLATKYFKLDEADKAYQLNDSEESATYFQKLTMKIIGAYPPHTHTHSHSTSTS